MQITSTSASAASAAQTQNSAVLLAPNIPYSPNIGGKTYNADLQLSGGKYVATIPALPNISASGSSLILAENNLDAKIRLQA